MFGRTQRTSSPTAEKTNRSTFFIFLTQLKLIGTKATNNHDQVYTFLSNISYLLSFSSAKPCICDEHHAASESSLLLSTEAIIFCCDPSRRIDPYYDCSSSKTNKSSRRTFKTYDPCGYLGIWKCRFRSGDLPSRDDRPCLQTLPGSHGRAVVGLDRLNFHFKLS